MPGPSARRARDSLAQLDLSAPPTRAVSRSDSSGVRALYNTRFACAIVHAWRSTIERAKSPSRREKTKRALGARRKRERPERPSTSSTDRIEREIRGGRAVRSSRQQFRQRSRRHHPAPALRRPAFACPWLAKNAPA